MASRTAAGGRRRLRGGRGAAAPVYDMADVAADPHLAARGALVDLDGVRMQGVVAHLSATPAELRHAGRPLGADQAILDADDPWAAAAP